MTNTKQTNSPREDELGVFWKRESKPKGDGLKPMQYLVGTINLKSLGFDKDVPLVVFKNKFKETDNQPDLRIYLSKPKTSTSPAPAPAAKARTSEPVKEEPATADADLLV